jgi:mercuric ion transport protein
MKASAEGRAMHEAKPAPPVPLPRGTLTYLTAAVAIVTCPCHLPILLALLSGTAAGAFLAENLGLAALVLLPIFLASALATWRLLDRREEEGSREAACGPCAGEENGRAPRR